MKRIVHLRGALILGYVAGLAFFYYKYVPLVVPFQVILLPILVVVAILTWRDPDTGVLAFVFAFPLVNTLPYFFKLYEPLPLAPTALVLFLFFFLGWLVRGETIRSLGRNCPAKVDRPLALFSTLILVSALISFFRYANFFPFRSGRIYELTVNRFGGTAGGAIMSVVFEALNYLTGFAFFFLLVRVFRSRALRQRAIAVFAASSFFSLVFALVQRFGHPALGNNPTSINLGLINGTFKDALSFGTFLSMAAPLFAGILVTASVRGLVRILAGLDLGLSLYLILFTGSKSGVLTLGVVLGVFLISGVAIGIGRKHRPAFSRRALGIGAVVLLGLVAGIVFFGKTALLKVAPTGLIERFRDTEAVVRLRLDQFWKPAFAMMTDYPVSGVGVGSYIIEVANYSEFYKAGVATPESAENYLIHIGAEFGLGGLIAVVWLVGSLLAGALSGYRRIAASPEKKARFLYTGAALGVLAFMINAQAHTYAGSYEIKYAFWFMAGLVVLLPGGTVDDAPGEKAASSSGNGGRAKSFLILLAGLAVLFGATLFWNSTHSLSLQARTERFGLKQDFGLDRWEKTEDGREFRWSREYAGLDLTVDKPTIVLPVHASHPDIKARPVTVEVYLAEGLFKSKSRLTRFLLDRNDWQTITVSLPQKTGSRVLLLLTVSRTWNPQKTIGAPDPRNLGIAVGRVEFKD
jgi:hypothetical protein